MTYFLGSDCDIYMTTEHPTMVVSGGAATGTAVSGSLSSSAVGIGGEDGGDYSVIPNRQHGLAAGSRISDVTGIDFSPSARSEDLSFIGKKTSLSAEIKKEYAITVTRKVSNNTFDILFNTPARNGCYATSGADAGGTVKIHDGLTTSKNRNFGYRIHLKIKADTEVVTIRNCCITAHTRTLDPNNAQEETIEFYSYVQPIATLSGTAVSCTGATAATDI
jgi:hypothetical protein